MDDSKQAEKTHLLTKRRLQVYCAKRLLIIPGFLGMSVIMIASVWTYLDPAPLVAWLGLVALVSAARYLHMRWYALRQNPVVNDRFHLNSFSVGTLTYSLCWAYALLQFSANVSQLVLVVIFLLTGLISAASVITMSGLISLFLLFNIPIACATFLVVIQRADISTFTGSLVAMFYSALLYYAIHLQMSFIEKFRLKSQNEELLMAEQEVKLRLEKLNRDLEERINQRTKKLTKINQQLRDSEEKLRKREILYQQAEQMGRLGHWEWDEVSGKMLNCSDEYAAIFELTAEEILSNYGTSEKSIRLVHPDDRERHRAAYSATDESRSELEIEFRIITKSGRLKYVNEKSDISTDENGKIIRSFGTMQDITEQKKVELELRQQQLMFEEAERLGKLGHWEWDELENRMISCSQQYAEIFGMSREEMMAVASEYEQELLLVHPDDRGHRRQMDIYTRQMGLPMKFEFRIITKDGDVRYVQTSSDMEVDSEGHSVRSFGTLQDITERKTIELEMQQREAMFERAEALGKLGHWGWDEVENRLAYCSRQYASIFDMTVEEMMMQSSSREGDLELVHPDDRDFVKQREDSYYSEGVPMEMEYRVITSHGEIRHVRQMSDIQLSDNGIKKGFSGTLQDITETKLQQEKFENAELIGNFGHWEWDFEKDRLVYCSAQYAKIYERTVDGCMLASNSYENIVRQVHLDDRQLYHQFHEQNRYINKERQIEFRLITGKGNTRVIRETTRPVYNDNGELIRTVGTVQDITDRVEVANKLTESRNQFKHIFDNAPIGMALIDMDGVISEINQAALDMLGYEKDRAIGLDYVRLTHPDELAESVQRLRDLARGLNDHYSLVKRFRHRLGHYIWVDMQCSLVRDPKGKPHYIIIQGIDITEQRILSQKLAYQASHDSLTSLINRHEFEIRLNHLLENAIRHESEHTFCYMDLDQFKIINDTFGHAAGDELLRQLCNLIQGSVRSRDTLARLGGDEFGLLMEYCTLDDALKTAESLRTEIDEFRFIWEDRVLSVGISMGIVSIDQDSGSIDELMKAADGACYMAKEQGRNRIMVHSETDEEAVSRRSEIHWASRIEDALAKDQLFLVGQSIKDLRSDKKEHDFFELLLRVRDESGELVSAAAMLSAAERYDMITKIDEWVVAKACSSILSDSAFLEKVTLCSINLSGRSISTPEFLDYIERTIEAFHIPPGKICFEITETSAISNYSNASTFIERLRVRGFHFALDDFGTGLSSFAYLKKLPVDFIKIDGSFIKDILNDPTDMSLVKSINELGHVYGKRTIAEYVESPELLEAVKKLGIDYAQGYSIGKPVPVTTRPKLVYDKAFRVGIPG